MSRDVIISLLMESYHLSRGQATALFIPALVAGLTACYMVGINHTSNGPGLPIDDAYIFMRYAENLSSGHGFSFNPGETSFGCTSFLWPLIIAVLFKLLGMGQAVLLMQAVGIVFLIAAVFLLSASIACESGNTIVGFIAGLFIALSPIGYMNAVSGMETALWMALPAGIFAVLSFKGFRPVLLGLLCGLCFLTRPEGLFFIAAVPIALFLLPLRSRELDREFLLKLGLFFFIALIVAAPYIIFMHSNTGHLLPTTYKGKIMAADPDILKTDMLTNLVWSLIYLGHGWAEGRDPISFLTIGSLFSRTSLTRARY